MSKPLVAYYRVSTREQGKSGLGIDAQSIKHLNRCLLALIIHLLSSYITGINVLGPRIFTQTETPHTLTEVTGPVFERKIVDVKAFDLTKQHSGEPVGERIVVSGRVLDENGRLAPACDRLELYVIDHDGQHMDRRQPQDIHVPLYNNGIGPGAARAVHYRIQVPKDAKGSIVLSAGVHYRKFSRDYETFSLGPSYPSLPVTTLASGRTSTATGISPV